MAKNLLTKYEFGGAGKKGMYYDEENRRHLLNIRAIYGEAAGNLADAGKKDLAQKLLDKVEAGINPENLPYGMVSRYSSHNQTSLLYLEACYKAGKTELAEKVRKDLLKDMQEQQAYYNYLKDNRSEMYESLRNEDLINGIMIQIVDEVVKKYTQKPQATSPAEGQTQIIGPAKDSL